MNLDDVSAFAEMDRRNLIAEIDGLPDQLESAWNSGQSLPLPKWEHISRVVITGMGSSAIGAEMLATYIAPTCQVPVLVNRNYTLPAWAEGPESLVIATSYAGDTEETFSAFEQALANECQVLAICKGGRLAEAAAESPRGHLWRFEHQSQMGAALGYSFGLPLAAFTRLNLIPDPAVELRGSIAAMKAQQESLKADLPIVENPAKRLAGQCLGRWVTVIAADHLVPVARRWKEKINEFSKAWAQSEELPAADHNTIAGVVNPETMLLNTMILFLRAKDCQPRNQLRANVTKEFFMLEGLGTDFVNAQGDSRLAQMWTALHFGDYLAYYLALAYGVDPHPGDTITGLKAFLEETT
jgi:glucose/mannose-6-phosphate isomerase